MNKKLLRKLTLSAVTLGVAAVSATTSTFAWFTTNGTVTANSISGTVKASDALVLIKSPTAWVSTTTGNTTEINPKYTTTVNQTDASGNAITTTDSNGSESTLSTESTHNFATSTTLVNEGGSTTTDLAPVAINSIDVTGSFVERTADTNTHAYTAAASNTHYLHYQVVLAISSLDSNKTYDVKMTLPSLNINTNSQYLLADSVASNHTSYNNYKTGQTISAGVKDVLSVGIKNTIVSDSTTAAKYGLSNGVNLTTANGDTQQYSDDASGWYHAIAEDDSGADAVTYYNNVYGLTGTSAIARPKHVKANPTDSDPGKDDSGNYNATEEYSSYYQNGALYKVTNKTNENDSTKTTDEIESINCTDKVIYELKNTTSAVVVTDLYFFIDGWDYQCFNAVSGMSLFATGSNQISFTVAQAAQAEDTE